MGQYYRPMTLNEGKDEVKKWIHPFDSGNGQKMMEHAYVENAVTLQMELELLNKPQPVAWVGDYTYSDLFIQTRNGQGERMETIPHEVLLHEIPKTRYAVNRDRMEYVKIPEYESDEQDLLIHPLPLLTRLTDDDGGGDYHGTDEELIGTWARNTIEITAAPPEGGYTEIEARFVVG